MKLYKNDISQQWNRQKPNSKYFAPVGGLMYFQVPCEVNEVQIVDVALNTMTILSTYNWAYGDIGNGEFVTNIEIDACNVEDCPFYIAFSCVNGDFYYSEQLTKPPFCPDNHLKLEAQRGCEIDFNGVYHGPLVDPVGNTPELQYKHCLWLKGSLTLPTYTVSYKYGNTGKCTTHLSSTTEQIRFLRAHNFAEWYAKEIINLVSSKALTIDGTPFNPQDVRIEPNKGTCLYNIDQELQERSQVFHAACLAECNPCEEKKALIESAGFFLNFTNNAGTVTVTFESTNYDSSLNGIPVSIESVEDPGNPITFNLQEDPYTIAVVPQTAIDAQQFAVNFDLGVNCELCLSVFIPSEPEGQYPIAESCNQQCLVFAVVGGLTPPMWPACNYYIATVEYTVNNGPVINSGSIAIQVIAGDLQRKIATFLPSDVVTILNVTYQVQGLCTGVYVDVFLTNDCPEIYPYPFCYYCQ